MRRDPQWVGMLALSLCACQEPTQITIEVSTDVPCEQRPDSGISVGVLAELDGKPPASTSTKCDSATGRIGSLVAVPASEGSSEVAFRIVTSVGGSVNDCTTPTEGDSCIVSRRALRYLDNKKLLVPVVQREICLGQPCDEDTTCVRGVCVPALIDPARCVADDGCGEETTPTPTDPPDLEHAWSLSFGTAGLFDRADGVAVDGAGNVYVAAFTAGHDFGDGNAQDVLVASFTPDGAFRWHYTNVSGATLLRGFGLDANRNAYFAGTMTLAGDFGGGSIGGASGADMFIASIDNAGNHRWSRAFGSSAQNAGHEVTHMVVAPSGRVFVTGHVDAAPVDIAGESAPANSTFVASFDRAGELVWLRTFAGASPLTRLALHESGDIFLAGRFSDTIALGGGLATTQQSDVFIAKLDADGNEVWAKRYGGPSLDGVVDLTVDLAGNVYVLGESFDAVDFGRGLVAGLGALDTHIASFDSGGELRWARIYGSDATDVALAITDSPAGNIFFSYTDDVGTVLESASPNGDTRWSKTFERVGSAVVFTAFSVGPQSELVGAGSVVGTVNLGGDDLITTGANDGDGLLVKFQAP